MAAERMRDCDSDCRLSSSASVLPYIMPLGFHGYVMLVLRIDIYTNITTWGKRNSSNNRWLALFRLSEEKFIINGIADNVDKYSENVESSSESMWFSFALKCGNGEKENTSKGTYIGQ